MLNDLPFSVKEIRMEHEETIIPDREQPQIIEEGPSLPVLLKEDFVRDFEKGVAIYKRWVSVCYRLTRETHWINHGTEVNPRYTLQGPGAEALMNPLGISFEKPNFNREEMQDGADGFYLYWCEGYMESKTLNRRGYYLGYCDSRDPFFNARPGWSPKTGQGDVKKAAMTNWVVNGVTRLAGLRDPDPDLLKNAGLDPQRITRIDYSGQKSNFSKSNGWNSISEPQQKRLAAIARQWKVGDDKLAQLVCEGWDYISSADNLWEVLSQIKRSDYDNIVNHVEKLGKAGK